MTTAEKFFLNKMKRLLYIIGAAAIAFSCTDKQANNESDYKKDFMTDLGSDSVTVFKGEIVDRDFFSKIDSIVSTYTKFKSDTIYLVFSYNEYHHPEADTIPIDKNKSFYVLAESGGYVWTHFVVCETKRYVYLIRNGQAGIFARNTNQKIKVRQTRRLDVSEMFSYERLAVSIYHDGELEYLPRDYYVDAYQYYYE